HAVRAGHRPRAAGRRRSGHDGAVRHGGRGGRPRHRARGARGAGRARGRDALPRHGGPGRAGLSMRVPRFVKLAVLAVRDLIASAGPVVFIVIGVLIAAYVYLEPQPPKTVRLATGPAGSAYAE